MNYFSGFGRVQAALTIGTICKAVVWCDNPQGRPGIVYIRDVLAEDGTLFSEYGQNPPVSADPWPAEKIEKLGWADCHPDTIKGGRPISSPHGGWAIFRRMT